MTRLTLLLSLAALGATGCASGYRVYVNGYSELDEPIDPGAPIHVTTDPNSQNPIFDRQVKAKAERLLRYHEYAVVDSPRQAEYELGFHVGMRSERMIDYLLVPDAYGGYYGHRWGYWGFGYGSYIPYLDREYDQWLTLRLFRRGPEDTDRSRLVWVGDAMMSTETASLRQAVDYLLIAALDILGADTGAQIRVTLEKDDPRLMELTSAP